MSGKTGRMATAVFLAGVLVAAATVAVGAGMSAPNWMPGFPLLAGPQVILMWAPVPGAAKYKVFLDGKEVGESAAFQYTAAAPEASGVHAYEVAAIGADGVSGEKSRKGEIKIITLEPPKNFASRILEDKTVTFRWDKAEGALLYNIFKGEGKSGQLKQVASVQDTRYADKDVKEGILYRYAVTSRDATGKESNLSVEVAVIIQKAEARKADDAVIRKVRVTDVLWSLKGAMAGGIVGPTDVEVDSKKGVLYVSNTGSKNVVVLGTDGQYQRTIGKQGNNPGELSEPKGLSLSPDRATLYVADGASRRVVAFDADSGAFKSEFRIENSHSMKHQNEEARKTASSQPPYAMDVAASLDGRELVVVDNPRNKVLLYAVDGKFLEELSGESKDRNEPGIFNFPIRAKFNARAEHAGDLIVSDPFGARFQILDGKSRKWARRFGSFGQSVGEFKGPTDALFLPNGDILVSDKDNFVVQCFSYDGKFKYLLGLPDGNPVDIGTPQGLALGDDGTVYVADYYGGRVFALRMTDKIIEK